MDLDIERVTAVVSLLGLLLSPVIIYLLSGWVSRRAEILYSFTDETVWLYFRTFFSAELDASKENLC